MKIKKRKREKRLLFKISSNSAFKLSKDGRCGESDVVDVIFFFFGKTQKGTRIPNRTVLQHFDALGPQLPHGLGRTTIFQVSPPFYNLIPTFLHSILFSLMDASRFSRWTRFAKKGGIGKCVALQDCVAEQPGDLMFFKVPLSLPFISPSFAFR